MSSHLVKYALMAAFRDRLVLALFLILILGSALAVFLGSAAVVEKDFFTTVFTGGILRITGVMGVVLFVVFFVRRAFDSKDVEFLLSRPIGRISFLLSYSLAFSIMAFFLSLAIGLCIYAVSPHMFSQGHMVWVLSIIVENIIMVNVALFFAMYLSSAATAAMCIAAFYVLARMMGQLLGIIDSSLVPDIGAVSMAVQLISVITPRLDLMGQTSWLIYGVDTGFGLFSIMMQGLVFCFLILLAAMLDFTRRQF
jgi:hypothetical protein